MSRVSWFLLYLVAFWGATLSSAAVFYLISPTADDAPLRGLVILAAILYFAWAMPRTGRASWNALGLLVPILNAYLFFSTFWRLAGLRAGVLPPSQVEPTAWGVRPSLKVALAVVVGLVVWLVIEPDLPRPASWAILAVVIGLPIAWLLALQRKPAAAKQMARVHLEDHRHTQPERSRSEDSPSASSSAVHLKEVKDRGATRWRSPFNMLTTTSGFLRSANNTKAIVYGVLALLLQLIIGFSPILIGLGLLFRGMYLAAVLVPILIYIMYGLYMAFWPIWAILMFIGVWREEGFLAALFSTVLFVFIMFLLFAGPEWLITKANEAAMKAEFYAQFSDEESSDKDATQ